ncbi:hypothetical protein NQD34_016126 [Periophthalmus magnuspinnatus]|nr:hypothetical protein NQD34_016126 [Periophthalmus magnuspinnatus]
MLFILLKITSPNAFSINDRVPSAQFSKIKQKHTYLQAGNYCNTNRTLSLRSKVIILEITFRSWFSFTANCINSPMWQSQATSTHNTALMSLNAFKSVSNNKMI